MLHISKNYLNEDFLDVEDDTLTLCGELLYTDKDIEDYLNINDNISMPSDRIVYFNNIIFYINNGMRLTAGFRFKVLDKNIICKKCLSHYIVDELTTEI